MYVGGHKKWTSLRTRAIAKELLCVNPGSRRACLIFKNREIGSDMYYMSAHKSPYICMCVCVCRFCLKEANGFRPLLKFDLLPERY